MRRKLALLCGIMLVLLCTGCSTRYTVEQINSDPPLLQSGQRLYLSLPADFSNPRGFGAAGSGKTAVTLLREALAPYASAIQVADTTETRQPSLLAARKAEAAYLFMLTLTWWRDHDKGLLTTQSASSAYLSVFDTVTGKLLVMRRLAASDESMFTDSSAPEHFAKLLQQAVPALFSPLPVNSSPLSDAPAAP